jgi:hypothetical protein
MLGRLQAQPLVFQRQSFFSKQGCAVMPFPLLFAASALLAASFIASAFAIPAGPKRDIQYCTVDDILGPLSSYLPIQADVNQFCSTLIGITNVDITVATTTPISCVATSQTP